MNKKWLFRIILVLLVLLFFYFFTIMGFDQYFTLASLKENQNFLLDYSMNSPLFSALIFILVYVLVSALSLPGAAVIMTLAGGMIFGLFFGVVLVSFASTIGATLAFLSARFLFKEAIQNKYKNRAMKINEGIKKEGAFYLFTLRLVPLFPFFIINLVMGLTSMSAFTFFIVSQIGMLPGTMIYVNAGTQLSKLDSVSGLLSPSIIISFILIGILPLLSKWIIEYFKSMKAYSRFKKPKNFDYNMLVIGAGSAGLVSAYIAAAVKAKVALVEKHKMGGDCLNTGCVPSKALIKSAKIFKTIQRANEFGIHVSESHVNFSKVMERVQKVIQKIEPHDSVERYTELGVECISGNARIRTPFEVEVDGKVITTKNIVVATGASPFVPSIPGLSEIHYLTSDNIWNLKQLPKKLIVLGGGPIGAELAQCFCRLGSEVTLIEMAPRILMKEDEEVSQRVTESFISDGMSVKTSHKAIEIKKTGDTKSVVCKCDGEKIEFHFDEILIALGRKANVKGFGLEELGVEVSQKGTIEVDEYLRTKKYSNIYACGDVTGPFQFTHTASHQAWFVAVNALFNPLKKFKVDYRVIPWCTFTEPEVARVGLNELEAKEKEIDYEVSVYGIDDLDRAIADGEAYGFVKVLTPPGSDKILGVTIMGDHAGDIISEYVSAMKNGFGLNKILGTIHIYPTLAEANKFAAGVWKKNHAPKKVLEFLRWFHEVRRG